ncbi:hypothetical protein EVU91_01365 [Macrococcoides bohemicum]|uniref:hypothetical protein n=1 Tax=Macrococcoides bohemicum TaxID=1903056 RepID=UPI00105A8E01|nr:hypothetical protein [Macrococcus bohemicus]TDL40567.1 hypothetical protein EVU91_01365 [Macrococcus bohemicus]
MKTIKRERQIRLDELLKHVWDNGIKNEVFAIKDSPGRIRIDRDGDFFMDDRCDFIRKRNLFTITEEVEITEDTVLPRLACVHSKTNNISCYNDVSIKQALHLASFDKLTFKQIYLQNDDGSIGELIWKDGVLL